jgi:iron complex transport system substrate-binding protein
MRKGIVELENVNKSLGGEKKKKMKTKNKTLALMEIAIVLCSMFLVAIPAIAADQNQAMQKASATASIITTASEDDYILGIYGNANEDDTIDMGDVVYTKLAIFGKKPKTELCDAKYDGRINVLDVIQTKLIILGKEKELTVIDTDDRIVTVKKPITSIACTISHLVETLRSIKVEKSMIVGLTDGTIQSTSYFPEFGDVPSIGSSFGSIDVEMVVVIHPDIVLIHPTTRGVGTAQVVKKLEAAGITVYCSRTNIPTTYVEEMRKLGYIFGKQDEAEEFIAFYEGFLNSIVEKVEDILEEDKPKVYSEYSSYSIGSKDEYPITLAGGKSIFAGMPTGKVDPEAVATNNPDVIVCIVTDEADTKAAGDTATLIEARTEMMGRPMLQNVAAVKNERVYVITSPFWPYLPHSGCRHFIGVGYLAKWFHPELFEDLDPKAIHQEYITRFQGLDIDLDKQGVFAYPEPG